MRHRFGVLVALRVRDGEHVQRVIVVGILIAHETKMRDGLIVLAGVDGERRGVEPLVDRFRRRLARRRLTLTDVQVLADALVKFLFLRILAEDRFERVGGFAVCVTLEELESALVERDRLEICRSTLRPRLSCRRN